MVHSTAAAVFSVSLLSLLSSVYALPFAYGLEKVRGVNLGGWLVLEPWITPSLFDNTQNPKIVDEWTFGQLQEKTIATKTLKDHWDTWITEVDFAAIAAAGFVIYICQLFAHWEHMDYRLNHVRLPIGYWAFEVRPGEPYIQGQLPYLEQAVTWAENHKLKVIVDLHGAPGSQNGFDNSGHKLPAPTWQTNTTNVERTNNVIKTITGMFKDSSVVVAIAPLNEPAGFVGGNMMDVVTQYWKDSYNTIRNGQEGDTIVLLHDAFQPPSYWDGFMAPPQYQAVMMDTHIYQVFFAEGLKRSSADHIKAACDTTLTLQSFTLPPVVGEWTPAMTDCAKYLNGRNIGARYDGTYPNSTRIGSCTGLTGSASTFSSSFKSFLRQMWEAQVVAYEEGGEGWFMWTWKTESTDEWSYQAGLNNGWIPSDPTMLQNPAICD
ncbi:glycoside hydrolase family 5 protein [Amanita muscaria]